MKDSVKQNTIVLANAVQVVTGVVKNLAGNDISNQIDGETVRPGDLSDAATARIQKNLSRFMETV